MAGFGFVFRPSSLHIDGLNQSAISMKNLYLFAFSLIFCFTSRFAAAQAPWCGQNALWEQTVSADSLLVSRRMAQEAQVFQFFSQNTASNAAKAVATVPVVVHILHDDGPENLSNIQVQQAIQRLNQAFANSDYYDQGSGADVPIRFCLATRAPDGSATNGINRVQTPLTDMTLETDDGALKTLIRWEPEDYINIWIVRSICSTSWGCGVAGYATQPVFHGSAVDGLVLEYAYFGGAPINSSPVAHETGHYFGLYHTFEGGCLNGDCLTDGDRVCDTPPDQSVAGLPCDQQVNSCATDSQSGLPADLPDDTKNFMDYGNLACQHDFTAGQAARMDFFLQNTRASLLASDGCGQPCPALVVAAFSPDALIAAPGATLNFTNQSQNAAGYSWSVNGAALSTLTNLSYLFENEGVYTISLTAQSADPALCPTQTSTVNVQIVCPAKADFQASDLEISPGETVVFTNTSQNATQFEWFLNGVSQGAEFPAFTFSQSGSFSIRLEAGNGACERSKTLVVLVQDSCAKQSFQKIFGTEHDERGVATIVLDAGHLLVGGDGDVPGYGRQLLLAKTDLDGNPLWVRHFGQTTSDEVMQDLAPLAGGGFVALFTTGASSELRDAAAAAFSADGDALWQRQLNNPGDDVLTRLRPLPGGGFLASGFVQPEGPAPEPKAYFLKFDNAGNPVFARSWGMAGQAVYATDGIAVNDTAFVASGYFEPLAGGLRQPLMLYFNADGSVLRARTFENDLNLGMAFRNVVLNPNDITGSSLFFYGEVINPATVPPTVALFQIGLPATLPDPPVQYAALPNFLAQDGSGLTYHDVLLTGNRLIGAGNSFESGEDEGAWLILNGNTFSDAVVYRQYTGLGRAKVGRVCALPDGSYAFTGLTGTNDGPRDLFWLKTSIGGFAGACAENNVDIATGFVTPILKTIGPAAATLHAWQPVSAFGVQPYDALQPANLCAPDCLELPCKATWRRLVEKGVGAIMAPVAIVKAPDGTFFIGSRISNSTLLLNLTPDGTITWARQFDFSSRNDRLLDLTLDSDGKLLGVGFADQFGIPFAGFAFKYDPVANIVLWVQEEAQDKRSRFTNIFELSAGGNYLINGIYPTGDAAQPDNDPVLMEVDRNTGELVAGGFHAAFDLDQNEEFQTVKRFGDAVFAVGSVETPTDPNGYSKAWIGKFDLSGALLWSKVFHFPNSAVTRLQAMDIAADGDSLLVALHGDFSGNSALTQACAIVKMTAEGDVLWGRKYTNNSLDGILANLFLRNLVAGEDCFFALGRDFLFRINPAGQLRWAHQISQESSLNAAEGRRMMAEKDDFLYYVAKNSTYAFAVSRVRASNGDTGQPCALPPAPISDLPVTTALLPFGLTRYDQPLALESRFAAPSDVTLQSPVYPCGSPCQEFCENGVSDDYDNLVDCLDPDCNCLACEGETTRIWYFGQHAGLDFSTDPPAILTDGATDTPGGSSTLCDGNGRLLAYTDGQTIFNRNHTPMPNGTGLAGAATALHPLIVPDGSAFPTSFFVFTPSGAGSGIELFSKLDMLADNGLGDLPAVTKNQPISSSLGLTGKVAAIRPCASPEIEVWQKSSFENAYILMQFSQANTPQGYLVAIYNAGTPVAPSGSANNFGGQLKWNRAGNRLANLLPGSGGFDVLYYDAVSDILTAEMTVLLPELSDASGVEFSPGGRYLYVSTPLRVFQFDLFAGDVAAVMNSRILLAESPVPRFGALQMAPNGKIYVATGAGAPSGALDAIYAPDQPGLACQYQTDAQSLGAGKVGIGLNNSLSTAVLGGPPPLRLVGPDSLCGLPAQGIWTLDPVLCYEYDSVSFTLSGGALNYNVQRVQATFIQPGEYTLAVYVKAACGISSDTVRINVLDNAVPPLDLGPDLQVCENGVFTLRAGPGFARYRWQDGSADSSLTTVFPGKYWVTVWDVCGQTQTDTVTIAVDAGTQLDLGPNRTVCRLAGASFERPGNFTSWQWSPAVTLDCDTCAVVNAHPPAPIQYVVSARNADGCISTDTVLVSPEVLTLTVDTMACAGAPLDFYGVTLAAIDTAFLVSTFSPDGCDLDVTVDVATLPAVTVALPPDTTLKIGAMLALTPQVDGSGMLHYTWTPPGGLSCADCPEPVFEALQSAAYLLTVADANGCSGADSIRLTVLDTCGVRAPDAFSPDRDGLNETFYLLTDPCVHTIRSLRIFTRWGEEVFRQVNAPPNRADLGWDGRSNGRDFPADVLLWVAELEYFDGRRAQLSGELLLLR